MVHRDDDFSNKTNISVTREKAIGEITPIRVEQSKTHSDKESMYAAGRAIDKKFYTCARTEEDSDGIRWLKVTFDKVHCISKAIWYRAYSQIHTWTCTNDGCSNCVAEGTTDQCNTFFLTVSTEGAASDLPSIPDCQYGDTVKLWKESNSITVGELVIIENIIGKELNNMVLTSTVLSRTASSFLVSKV